MAIVLKNRQVFPNTEMPICVFSANSEYYGLAFPCFGKFTFGVLCSVFWLCITALSKALSGLGATAPIARRLAGGLVMEQDERSGSQIRRQILVPNFYVYRKVASTNARY